MVRWCVGAGKASGPLNWPLKAKTNGSSFQGNFLAAKQNRKCVPKGFPFWESDPARWARWQTVFPLRDALLSWK